MVYFFIWILVLAVSFYLFKKASGSMSLLTPNLISLTFYYSLLISSFIGSLLVAMNIDDHYMIKLLSDDVYRYMGFFFLCFIMLFMPLSMLLVGKLFGFQAEHEFKAYLEAPVYKEESSKLLFYLYVFFTFLAVAAIGYTILKVKSVPLLEMLKGADNLSELRITASKDFGGSTIIRNIFGIALAPLLSMITFVHFYQKKEYKWFFLFAITTCGALFMQVYDLAKAPIFFYMIMVILLLIYLRIIRLTWLRLGVLLGGAVVLLVVMYIFIMGVTDPSQFLSYNKGPVGRMLLSQIAPFYLHLDLFTNRVDLLGGRSLPSSIIGLYDMDQVRSAKLAMEAFFPAKVEAGTAGVLNTLYAAEAYANFGYAGLLIGTMYVGIYIQVVYMIFVRLPKTPLFLSLFVFFTVNIPRVIIGGFADFLWNPQWIAVLVILVGPYILLQLYKVVQKARVHAKEGRLGNS
ncbi:oligosaccharide repeat unit polymerase [Metabacillus sp. GX 13764]|uniref:oligosaccharide repeat unit polymerase n=1 Tax=Metabacillus kandeliae TaxID=2900151 RepID=UPI001E47BBFD|nr:oligosaccharide repeat unit polymerase [Metabacillus kandeliae]MCD7034466.1 oligosaccharide repeat unit polymerase [Metabacillus kandeliae]